MIRLKKAFDLHPSSVNGLKTILGAALVVLAGQVDVLGDLIPVLPEFGEQLQAIIGWIKAIIEVIEWILKLTGNGLLGLGFVHKIIKLFG